MQLKNTRIRCQLIKTYKNRKQNVINMKIISNYYWRLISCPNMV